MDMDCQMVGEPIPADLCSAEQGSHHCSGCIASTRRCVACQQTRGIADASRGLCADCAEKNPKEARRGEVDKTVSSLLETFNDEVGKILDAEFKLDTVTLSRSAQSAPINPSILSQPDLIYGVLCEHALMRDDCYYVRNVMQVLAIRVRLTEDESKLALRELVNRGQIELLADGEIRLLKDIEAVAKIIERRGEEYTVRGVKSRAKKFKSSSTVTDESLPKPVTTPRANPPATSRTPVRPPEPIVPTVKGPTVGDVFRFVRNASMMIGDVRVARAVVPTVGARMKLGPQDVIAALEALEKAGAIVQKDGWRVVVILKEDHDDATPVATPKVATSKSRAPSTRERRERLHLRVVPGGEGSSTDDESAVDPSPPSASTLDAAIEQLESALPTLRTLRDQVNAKVAMLELSLTQLKSAKAHAEQAESEAKQTLANAEVLMSDLLSTLRRKA